MPLLASIRAAFRPKDPLYRRESGADRKGALSWKIVGVGIVVSVYGLWVIWALTGENPGLVTVNMVAGAAAVLSLVALGLGIQSVHSEVSDGTAEALVMTPLPRRTLIISKLAGSAEFMVVAALFLPLYCSTGMSYGDAGEVTAYVHGGLLRWLMPASVLGYESAPWSALWGLLAFGSDVSWYLLFVACGIWAAASRQHVVVIWLRGLSACVMIECVWFVVERAGAELTWYLRPTDGRFHGISLGLLPDATDFLTEMPVRNNPVWLMAIFLAVSMALRLLVAWGLILRAARHFDRIATD